MFTVSLHKPVFVLYSGLIASGYDLTRIEATDPLYHVVNAIKATDWDPDALSYFSKARLNHGGVNPYWPRAAMLLHAAFHLDPLSGRVLSHRFSDCRKRRLGVLSEERFSFAPGHGAQPAMVHATPDFMQEASLNTEDVFDFVANAPDALPAAVLKAIKEFPVDESQKDDETVNWVKGYPRVHVAFESHPDMVLLWDWYQSVMGPSRLKPFEAAAADALSALALALGIETDVKADTGTDIKTSTETYIETGIKIGIKGVGLPYLNVIPNPLQSPMLADFVHKDDAVHAIVAEPRLTSVVHELLHGVLADALRDSRAAVLDFRHLFTSALVSSMTGVMNPGSECLRRPWFARHPFG